MLVDLWIHVTVSDKDVLPAIIVKIQELDPKAKEGNADGTKARAPRQIGELTVVVVVIEIVAIIGKVGLHDVRPAVMIVVDGINAHACLLSSIRAICHT